MQQILGFTRAPELCEHVPAKRDHFAIATAEQTRRLQRVERGIAVAQPLVGLRELVVRHPEFRIEKSGLPRAFDCGHVVASREGDLRGERVVNEIKRVQFAGAPHRHERIFVPPQRRKDDSKHPVRQTRTGIERDGSAAGGFRSRPVPVEPEFHDA